MGPVALASQLAAGIGVLAGAVIVKNAMDSQSSSVATWTPPRCATCNGTGRTTCMCTRWSDGDVGCRTCSGSGRMACRNCGGSGTGRPMPVQLSLQKNNNRNPYS
ncbi:hypothetical protein LUZ60_004816 [Juncus effusus]|nr:hypothetical protein LUZ60_004816 [Juncus effusus]